MYINNYINILLVVFITWLGAKLINNFLNGDVKMKKTKRFLATIMTVIMMFTVFQIGFGSMIASAATEKPKYYYEVVDDNSPARAGTNQDEKKLKTYNKGALLTVYAVVVNKSTNHKWVKIKLKNSAGEAVDAFVYIDHCEKRADITSTDSKLVEVTKVPTAKYWDRPYSDESYGKNSVSKGTYNAGQTLKVSQTIKTTNGKIWYKIYNEVKYIYSENVRNHGCMCSAQPISKSYSKTADKHTVTAVWRNCVEPLCANYSKTYTTTTTEKHNFAGGICEACKYEYKLTVDDANRKYTVTDTSGAPVYSRPYKKNSNKYGPIPYGTTLNINAQTVNEEGHTWYKISSGEHTGKWIWSDHLTRTYTITYNANGGSNAPAATEFLTGKTAKITSSKPTRSGYVFSGWSTSKESSKVEFKPGDGYSTKKSIKLYAVWEMKHTINFDANGGSVSPASKTFKTGDKAEYPQPIKNYTITYDANGGSNASSAEVVSVLFKGWSRSKDGSDGRFYYCGTAYNVTSETLPNQTVYAIWGEASATVSSKIPVRSGYTFLGWSKNSLATKVEYSSGSKISMSGNTTLYAVWKKDVSEISVVFDATGGKVSPSYIEAKNNSLITLPIAERSGHKFLGWRSKKDGDFVEYYGGKEFKVTGNVTLYAVWENYYNLGEETYWFDNFTDGDSDIGHCFGMAVTSSAYYMGILDVKKIGIDSCEKLNTVAPDSNVLSNICHYQAIQGPYIKFANVAGDCYEDLNNLNTPLLDWISVVNYVKDSKHNNKGDLILDCQGEYMSNGKKKTGGHAINFIRYENVNGQDRIYVYDSNFPNEETYFYKGNDGNIYEAPKSTFTGKITRIGLMSVEKYLKKIKNFDPSRAVYAKSGTISIEGVESYPMMGGEDGVMYEIPDGVEHITITALTEDAEFEYLGNTYNFSQVDEDSAMIFELAKPNTDTPEKDVLYGDVNNDGNINSSDALMVLQSSVEQIVLTEEQIVLADVNKDTKVNSTDALLILQYVVGKIERF